MRSWEHTIWANRAYVQRMLESMKKLFIHLSLLLASAPAFAWGPQGHKLVALVAEDHLTPMARRNVKALLGPETLADVASWPDVYRPLETQTALWHYVDLPAGATAYDRDRDCPTQPNVKLGTPNDKWRDCVVDRILFFEGRVADTTLDQPDRATALKYLIHFIGDIHQPFHAYGPERGGNGILVVVFGSPTCGKYNCNLHAVWDSGLILHRGLTDRSYRDALEQSIRTRNTTPGSDNPAIWTAESMTAATGALVPNNGTIDETYYMREIPILDERLALAGLRLAAFLNRTFTSAPVKFVPQQADSKQF